MKGWRTTVIFLAQFVAALFAWPQITAYIDPQWIALGEAAIALILRYVTTTPIGQKS